jgi:hypothetical protein
MNPNSRELLNHIRSGPAELVLDKSLRFRRRTCTNPCDFNKFLQVLQSSETIRDVTCRPRQRLGISEDEWVLLVKTIGSIEGIQNVKFACGSGSHAFRPFQAIAEAVNNARSLCILRVDLCFDSFSRDPSGMIALALSLREHTALQEFTWIDWSFLLEAAQITALSTVLQSLPACPHLRKATILTEWASVDAVRNLLHLHKAADLRLILKPEQWLAVADEIRQGRCNVQRLTLSMVLAAKSEATKVVKAVASAIRLDQNLEYLLLQMENGFKDEAGVALAEALTVNKTLRRISLSVTPVRSDVPLPSTDALDVPVYEAFSAMLRGNTSLQLDVPPLHSGDRRLVESHNQMIIEQQLNQVGRGRLVASSSHTTREEWVDALHELSTFNVNSLAFDVSCLYSLLRLNPAICMLRVDDTSNHVSAKFAVM